MVKGSVDEGGYVPEVILDPVEEMIDFTDGPTAVSLSATAFDDDGKILEVSFYGNGALLESDTSSPYSSLWISMRAGIMKCMPSPGMMMGTKWYRM